MLPLTLGPLYTVSPPPAVLYPPAASLSNSRDLSSCIHDTPGLGWLLHIYSEKHTGLLLCALWYHRQNCTCSLQEPIRMSQSHSRMPFCSPHPTLTVGARTEHACRMNEQSGWHISLVIIWVNKAPRKGPSATSLENPSSAPPGSYDFPLSSPALLQTSVKTQGTIILYLTKTFFKMLPIIIKICIQISKMLTCEKKNVCLRIEKCDIFPSAPQLCNPPSRARGNCVF